MENGKALLITFTVVIILLVIGFVGLFYYTISQNTLLKEQILLMGQQRVDSANNLSDQIEELKNQLDTNNDLTTNTSPTPDTGVTYINSDFGFNLQLPSEWTGYTVDKKVTANVTLIYFGLKNWSNIFAIGIYTKDQWSKIGNDEMAKRSYLDENNNYVFTGAKSQDFGTAEYNKLVSDYEQIIETFKVFNSTKK